MKIEQVSSIFGASKPYKKNNKKNNKTLLYSAGAATIMAAGITTSLILANRKKPDKYLVELAYSMSKDLNKKIRPSDLQSVMTKTEFLREVSQLKPENFIASPTNIKDGTFIADLHSHSTFSDGTLSVKAMMEQAANYGDKLNQINGKKFIFALTDHDGVEGVKEALKIIAENPEKFKNIKFIPAAELSFVEECSPGSARFYRYNSTAQMPEMLIYNINPFSQQTTEYFSNLCNRRKEMTKNMIAKANNVSKGYNFSLKEFEQYIDKSQNKYYLLNHHWCVYDYLQLKTRLVDIARENKKDEKTFFEEIIKTLKNEDRTPGGLSKYIKENNIKTTTPENYDRIKDLSDEFFPGVKTKIVDGKEVRYFSNGIENPFDVVANYALEEQAYMAFAHPGYTMQNFTETECYNKMRSYILRSKGTLRFTEKYHQAYCFGESIGKDELNKYHNIIDKFNLFNIGGRDNHSNNFADFK